MNGSDFRLSVLMVVYIKDDPSFFKQAIQSLCIQTINCNELVLVENGGLLPEHYEIIELFRTKLNIISLQLDENLGLGVALNKGLEICSFPLVARMDSDDICTPERFEKQLLVFKEQSIDVVGSNITEFNAKGILSQRIVKEFNEDIVKVAKYTSPVNHVTVMFKKESVLNSGNYPSFLSFEDYPLWVNMIIRGMVFYNIQESLVNVRVDGFNSRRSGLKYAVTEAKVMLYFYKIKFHSLPFTLFIIPVKFLLRTIFKLFINKAYRLVRRFIL